MKNKYSHILEVKEKDGYLYIELPNSLMKKMGWKTGDTIDWHDNKDGTWSLLKVAMTIIVTGKQIGRAHV